MPRALEERLNRVLDVAPQRRVEAERPNWNLGAVFGSPIADVRAVVVHETSGWPPRRNGENMFFRAFFGGDTHAPHTGETTQLYVSGDGTVVLGMALPGLTWHANFVNWWALGTETGHGWGNYAGNDHLGPHTSTNEIRFLPDGTKNPAFGGPAPLAAKPGNRWIALSGNPRIDRPEDDDLPGVKIWIRHASFEEIAVGWWTTERYAGPWRQPQRVPEMVFSEWQYRSWALLARYLAERFLIPRNFPVLPHKTRAPGNGTVAGQHGMVRDADSFRSIVRGDEILFRSLARFGLTEAQLEDVNQLRPIYQGAVAGGVNRLWRRVFDVYRGFHGHGFSGDPDRGEDHDCPGPLFDWHRFAREVWDWWWHPFDFNADRTRTNVDRRPYCRDDRNGDTRLDEHFFSTPAAAYATRAVAGIHGASGSPQTYRLEPASPVYALANGELVAARFPPEADRVSLAFVLVRHEVFHRPDPGGALVDALLGAFPTGLPQFAGRIDYDVDPSIVYTLYMHLGRPPGMSFDAISTSNPDWLNRLLARKTEAHLGVEYHRQHAADIPAAKWEYRPPGNGPVIRPTLLEAWTVDEANFQPTLDRLRRGEMTLMPRHDPFITPVRVLLGDFLGHSGIIRRTDGTTEHGIRVEVFSRDVVSTDFLLTQSDATRCWDPVAGTGEPPAVLYPSEWARTPEGAEKAALEAAGVNTDLVNWWGRVAPVTFGDATLPSGGTVVHYDPPSFMTWITQRTWRSEWPKYRIADPAAIPAQPRPRTG